MHMKKGLTELFFVQRINIYMFSLFGRERRTKYIYSVENAKTDRLFDAAIYEEEKMISLIS